MNQAFRSNISRSIAALSVVALLHPDFGMPGVPGERTAHRKGHTTASYKVARRNRIARDANRGAGHKGAQRAKKLAAQRKKGCAV